MTRPGTEDKTSHETTTGNILTYIAIKTGARIELPKEHWPAFRENQQEISALQDALSKLIDDCVKYKMAVDARMSRTITRYGPDDKPEMSVQIPDGLNSVIDFGDGFKS